MYQWYILIATMTSLGKSALLTNLFSLNLFIKLHCDEKKKEQILWTKKVLAQEGADICVSDSHHYIAKTQHCKALIFQFKNNSKQIKAYLELGFPGGVSGKEPACQCRKIRNTGSISIRKIPWRRKWQSTPVFLSGESHGQKSLPSYSP